MPIRMLLADFDGTLVDSMPFWKRLPRNALAARAMPEPEDLDELIRTCPMWKIAGIFAERYPDRFERDALYASWMAEMAENYRTRIPLKAGAAACLDAVSALGIPVCLFSATNHGLLDGALEAMGFHGRFCAVITEADAGDTKRTDKPYLYAREKLGVPFEEMLLLEDSCANILKAKELGLRTCGVYEEIMAASWEELSRTADVALSSLAEPEPLIGFLRRENRLSR